MAKLSPTVKIAEPTHCYLASCIMYLTMGMKIQDELWQQQIHTEKKIPEFSFKLSFRDASRTALHCWHKGVF